VECSADPSAALKAAVERAWNAENEYVVEYEVDRATKPGSRGIFLRPEGDRI